MTVRLHWFLPTSCDGRTIVERFNADKSLGPDAPPAAGYRLPGAAPGAAAQLGVRGCAYPTRRLVRGRVAHHGGAPP